jgi:hypothetical protein
VKIGKKNSQDCRLSLRESSVLRELVFHGAKARNSASIAPAFHFSRKKRCFRGAKGDNGLVKRLSVI